MYTLGMMESVRVGFLASMWPARPPPPTPTDRRAGIRQSAARRHVERSFRVDKLSLIISLGIIIILTHLAV